MREKYKLVALSPLIQNLPIQAFKHALVLLHLQLKNTVSATCMDEV